MLTNYFLAFLSSFILGLISIFLFKKLSLRYKLLMPKGVPLIGGIAIGLAFCLGFLLGTGARLGVFVPLTGLFLGSLIILIFGVVDDRRELSVGAKFCVQITATAVLIFFGIRTQIVYIGAVANIIITLIWFLGITNAFNHLDVMDGLASGSAIIVSLAFFIVSALNGDALIAVLALSLCGAASGFFLYNMPPAKIYMGNAGSHFLGFVLAAIALMAHYAPLERKIALLSPLLILGFPIMDTAFLIMARISKKQLPFNKSNDHPALKFLSLGYSRRTALGVMFYFCFLFSASGVLLSHANGILSIVALVLIGLTGLFIILRMKRIKVHG